MNLRPRVIPFAAMVILVYAASLTWVFPGEFHPLTPHHPDMYQYVGLLSRPALEVASFPRPVIFLFYRTAGYLGVEHALAMPIAAMLCAALLAPFAIARITGERPPPMAFLAYLALLFTHPQFYFHHRHDGTAGLATLLVFLVLMAAVSWLRVPSWSSYAWALGLTALMSLSKETYALSLPVLVGALCLLHWRNTGWKRALALTGGVCVVEAIALGYDALRFLSFTGPIAPNSPYASDLHPASIFAVFRHYCTDAFSPFSVACCGVALLVAGGLAYRKRTAVIMPLAFILAGLLALIPNAILPRHYEGQYAWNAAPLVFAVLLFIPISKKWSVLAQAAVLVLAIVSIRANAPIYRSTRLQWLLSQEHANARITQALPGIRERVAGTHHILVSGLGASYHPWDQPDFLRQYFGRDVDWTFVIPGSLDESVRPNIAMLKASSVRLAGYECVVRFHDDGGVRDVLAGTAFRVAVTETPEAVLIPSLATQLAALKAKPDDFMLLLQAGGEALTWGLPERALPYLQHASRIDPANPYPWFFIGQAERDLKDYDSARADYKKAIAAAGRDNNPAFAQALSTLPSR
jgi:tetratricopeptide (TPR) repeat protein